MLVQVIQNISLQLSDVNPDTKQYQQEIVHIQLGRFYLLRWNLLPRNDNAGKRLNCQLL